MGWGLRVLGSQDLHAYDAGLYSFFNKYDASQFTPLIWSAIVPATNFINESVLHVWRSTELPELNFSIEGNSAIAMYNLNVLGSQSLVDKDGHNLASYSDNISVFTNVAYFSN